MQKFPILISYAYLRKKSAEIIDQLLNIPDVEILLDSGAFTAWSTGKPINVKDYISFLEKWGSRFFGYFALDVVKEPIPTRRNLYDMLKDGLHPIPVHVFGEGEEWLNELYKYNDWIALVVRQQMGDSRDYVRRVMKLKMEWAAGRRAHLFGCGDILDMDMLGKYKPYSCDQSTWSYGSRFGELQLYQGRGRWTKFSRRKYKGRSWPRGIANAILDAGFTREDISDPRCWKGSVKEGIPKDKHIPYQMSIRAWVQCVKEIRSIFGTRVFLSAGPESIADLLYWIRSGKGGVDESSGTRVGRPGQHGTPLPSGEGAARGGLRIVRRLRPAARTGARFRQEGLLDVEDSD